MLEIKVQDKSITTVQKSVFIRGTVGEKVAISCDDEWGDRLKTVVFKRLDPCAEPIVNYIGAVSKTEVVIPHEILQESGKFHIGLYSVMGAETTPTFWSEVFEIEYGTDTDGVAPQPPTPSEYSQLIQLAEETKEIANSVREDADIGVFNGADGKDGINGKDGTSVTVSKVTESTADGGSNVVAFSDGKTLAVKNGSKGNKGDKGDKGDAYILTETDKVEIADIITEDIDAALDEIIEIQNSLIDGIPIYNGGGGGTFVLKPTVEEVQVEDKYSMVCTTNFDELAKALEAGCIAMIEFPPSSLSAEYPFSATALMLVWTYAAGYGLIGLIASPLDNGNNINVLFPNGTYVPKI